MRGKFAVELIMDVQVAPFLVAYNISVVGFRKWAVFDCLI
jgi:hypothetical protein